MGKASSIWTIGYYYANEDSPNKYWRVDKLENDRMYYTYWYEDGTSVMDSVPDSTSVKNVSKLLILWDKIYRDTIEREVKEVFNG